MEDKTLTKEQEWLVDKLLALPTTRISAPYMKYDSIKVTISIDELYGFIMEQTQSSTFIDDSVIENIHQHTCQLFEETIPEGEHYKFPGRLREILEQNLSI